MIFYDVEWHVFRMICFSWVSSTNNLPDSHVGVSKYRGTPKWMVYNGKPPPKNGWFGGTPIFGSTHVPKHWWNWWSLSPNGGQRPRPKKLQLEDDLYNLVKLQPPFKVRIPWIDIDIRWLAPLNQLGINYWIWINDNMNWMLIHWYELDDDWWSKFGSALMTECFGLRIVAHCGTCKRLLCWTGIVEDCALQRIGWDPTEQHRQYVPNGSLWNNLLNWKKRVAGNFSLFIIDAILCIDIIDTKNPIVPITLQGYLQLYCKKTTCNMLRSRPMPRSFVYSFLVRHLQWLKQRLILGSGSGADVVITWDVFFDANGFVGLIYQLSI